MSLLLLLFVQLYGPTNPIPHLSISSDLSLSALPSGDFITQTSGTLAGLPVAVAATITRQQDVYFTMAAVQAKSPVNSLVKTLFGPVAVTKQLLSFVEPMQALQLVTTYSDTSSSSGMPTTTITVPSNGGGDIVPGGSFTIFAVPDMASSPKLMQIGGAVGAGSADWVLYSTENGLSLSTQQPCDVQLPIPLSRAGRTRLFVNQDSDLFEAVLSGIIPASLKLPGMATPVGLQLTTGLSVRKVNGQDAVASQLSSLILTPVSFDKFTFVQFGDLRLAAAATYSPLQLTNFMLSGPVTLFGASAPSIFVHDNKTSSMVFMSNLPVLDLQLLVQTMGVMVNLGSLNVQLSRVLMSYADTEVKGDYISVPAGMWFEADAHFLGMKSFVKFELTAAGAAFVAKFSSDEFTKVSAHLLCMDAVLMAARAAAVGKLLLFCADL